MTSINDILTFWFSSFKDSWFNPSHQKDRLASDFFEKCKNNMVSILGSEGCLFAKKTLALIIVFDQLFRHYRRVKGLSLDLDPYNLQTIAWAKSGIESGVLEELLPEERCFYLMPLRHSRDIGLLDSSIAIVNGFTDTHQIYNRFLKAASKARERLSYEMGFKLNEETMKTKEGLPSAHTDKEIWSIIDQSRHPFFQRVTGLLYDLYRPISMKDHLIYQEIKQQVKRAGVGRRLAISLSGGVDSTLLAWSLVEMMRQGELDEVVAVHINYRNRAQSDLEEGFVINWCSTHGVRLYVRRIDELSRCHKQDLVRDDQLAYNDRQFYERYTREIRFDMYKRLGCPIVLGHNRDDVLGLVR